MPVNREQMHMEQNQTVDNETYTVGDMVYYTGTGLTFENGDRLEHGKQGEVTGPATSERTGGRGLAVLFPGNEGALDCCFTEVRRLPPLSSLRCPSCPPPKAHNNLACGRTGEPRSTSSTAAGWLRGGRDGLLHGDG